MRIYISRSCWVPSTSAVPSSDMGRVRRREKTEKGGGVGIGGSGEGVNSLGGPMNALLALLLALENV